MEKIKQCILVSLILICTFNLSAQQMRPFEKIDTELQDKLITNFWNPDKNYYVTKKKSLDDYRMRNVDFDGYAKTYSLESNPILNEKLKKRLKKNKSVGDNIGVDGLIENTVFSTTTWGTITVVPDNKQIVFLQENEVSFVFGSGQKYYRKATFTLLDDNYDTIKSFSLETPDTTMLIRMQGIVTRGRLDYGKSELEFLVQVHGFDSELWGQGPKSCVDILYAINENGEIIRSWEDAIWADVHRIKGYNQKDRVTVHSTFYPDVEGKDTHKITIYPIAEEGEPLYVFEKNAHSLAYSEGPIMEFYEIAGKEYYINSFYRESFDSLIGQQGLDQDIVIRQDNDFIVELIDANSLKLAKRIVLPLIGFEDHNLSMSQITDFPEYSFTTDVFNNDSLIEIVYSMGRYYSECDCNKNDVYVVNENGKIITDLFKSIGGASRLQDISGLPTEYALFEGGVGVTESIAMAEMPEGKINAHFPVEHEGEILSLSFDRVSDNKGGRYYIFGSGMGEIINNSIFASALYFDVNGKLVKKDRIDIGRNVAVAEFIINTDVLNPFLINGTSEREYFINMKEYVDPSQGIEAGMLTSLLITSNDGTALHKFYNHKKFGNYAAAGILGDAYLDKYAAFYVIYGDPYFGGIGLNTVLYELPFEPVELEGTGTRYDPYIITNPAELDMVRNNDSAYYELGNNIDMANYTGVANRGFIPISKFKGQLDGKNYTIQNLRISPSGESIYSGASLIDKLEKDAEIRNLRIDNFTLLGSSNDKAPLVRLAYDAIIENCHVTGDVYEPKFTGTFAGLINQVSMNTVIQNCSFEGDVYMPEALVAGLARELGTDSKAINCFTRGSINGNEAAGLIGVSSIGSGPINCYSNMDVTAAKDAGGIISSTSGIVENTYSTGKIILEKRPNSYDWICGAGGIAGSATAGGLTKSATRADELGTPTLKNNVAMNPMVLATKGAKRIAYGIDSNTSYFENNYALNTMKIGTSDSNAVVVSENDPENSLTDMQGLSKSSAELTEEFFKSIGWKFGENVTNPWVMNEGKPHFYYEFLVASVELSVEDLTLHIGAETTLLANIIPSTASNKNVLWAISDPTIASINQEGVVTARKRGTTVITVLTEDGDFKSTCTLNVIQGVTSVELEKNKTSVAFEGVIELKASILPSDADNKILRWESLDENVVIAEDGLVFGVGLGSAYVVVSDDNRTVFDTCEVMVVEPVEIIILDNTNLIVAVGKTAKITATVRPIVASNKSLTWESSDNSIATVVGGVVTGLKFGETLVTAKSVSNPDITASCVVTVTGEISNEGLSPELDLQIYVNEDVLYINSNEQIRKIAIYNTVGSKKIEQKIGSTSAKIDLQSHIEGVYLAHIYFAKGNTTVIKIKK